jgi:serine phosphatase RsbU (regulator of sigma subunit)
MRDLRRIWRERMSKLDVELHRELSSAYVVRMILEELAEKARTVASRQDLALLLQKLIEDALHPQAFVCYLEAGNSVLAAAGGTVSGPPQRVSATSPLLAALARRGRASHVSELGADLEGTLSALAPEFLVPISGRDGRLAGALVLGQRASGEPYSRQDGNLLDSVASQAAGVFESLCVAERMAERMEAERHIQQEIEFARQVQAKLFPQRLPHLGTLDYAGRCMQARQVGGDYYDFLEMQRGRMAFVLADIAGKGLSGALLMANLQANLRSQYAMALANPRAFLTSVNRLFYENTDASSYATLFFADYDDASRRLRYMNCGHVPPVLLRGTPAAVGEPAVEELVATGTVLGLFKEWECDVAEVYLKPGDILAIYTDGVTEATDENLAEFGESGLLEVLGNQHGLSAAALVDAVVDRVERFQHGGQADDITLVVARCRA